MIVKLARHLRLSLPLLLVLAGAGIAMLNGWGANVVWFPQAEQPPIIKRPSPQIEVSPIPLQAYSEIWTQSLFNQDRSADPVLPALKSETSAPPLTGLLLTGVVISPPLHKAFFKMADGKGLEVNEGDVLPNGWTVESIEHERVFLGYSSTKQEMILPVLKIPAASLR
jgi:general secretion pathway protein N